jgi:hypothetical protein
MAAAAGAKPSISRVSILSCWSFILAHSISHEARAARGNTRFPVLLLFAQGKSALAPATTLNRMVAAHGSPVMCQYLGSLVPTAVHRSLHVCITRIALRVDSRPAPMIPTLTRFEPGIDAAHLDR